jgi:hypothetical protein
MSRMNKWMRVVDGLIADLIGDGDVSHLPGAGKKLQLNDDAHTPSEWRAAFKIMDDHDVTPEWIEAGKTLDQMESTLRRQINARALSHARELHKAKVDDAPALAAIVELKWDRFKEDYLKRVERYNREALVYNLSLPAGIPHKEILRVDALIAHALQDAETKL